MFKNAEQSLAAESRRHPAVWRLCWLRSAGGSCFCPVAGADSLLRRGVSRRVDAGRRDSVAGFEAREPAVHDGAAAGGHTRQRRWGRDQGRPLAVGLCDVAHADHPVTE